MERNYTSIRLEITSKCNLRCLCCHNIEYLNKEDDMSTSEILSLIKNLKAKFNIKKVLLTGGEPLLKEEIYMIIRTLTDMGIKVDMVTNGTLLSNKVVEKLQKAGLKRIRISIDEVNSKSELRGNIHSNTLWERAKYIIDESDIEVCIHTVASPQNVESLYKVYKKVIEIGAKRWRVFDIGYQGGVINSKEKFDFRLYYKYLIASTVEILKDYLLEDLKDQLDIEINNIFRTSFLNMKLEDFTDFNVEKFLEEQLENSPCEYVANHQISIRSDGKATLCQYFRSTIFDFKKFDFNVEKSIKEKKYVCENEIKLGDLEYCKNCKYCLLCHGGCRSRAVFFTENFKDADPVGCYIHKMVHNEVISILPDYVKNIYEKNILLYGVDPKYCEKDLEIFLAKKGYVNNGPD